MDVEIWNINGIELDMINYEIWVCHGRRYLSSAMLKHLVNQCYIVK